VQPFVGSMLLDFKLCFAAEQQLDCAQVHPEDQTPRRIGNLSCMSWNAQPENLVHAAYLENLQASPSQLDQPLPHPSAHAALTPS